MEDTDTLELTVFIQVVEHILVQNNEIAFFPLARRPFRRISKNVEFGDKLYAELPTTGKESGYVQDLAYVGSNRFVVSNEFFWAMKCLTRQARNLRTLEIIGVFHDDIGTEVADDFIPSFFIKMVGVFQELFAVHVDCPL